MVKSYFKFFGKETMRDRLKPYLQELKSDKYSYANEDTVKIMLSDRWKKERQGIVNEHFEGSKVRMNNPTDEDFINIAKKMFKSWYSTVQKSTMEDSAEEPEYGPGGDKRLNDWTSTRGALKKRKKKSCC